MPKNYRSTLNAFKRKLHGSIPKERDDFEPSTILGKIEHGEKVLVLDSNTDLPDNWKDINLREFLPERPGADCEDNVNPSDVGTSEDGFSSDGAELPPASGRERNVHSEEEDEDDEINVSSGPVDLSTINHPLPPRVLIFTTLSLLGLLAVVKKGSVDGTFKSMTKKWKQLFILLVNFKDSWIPIAFGWLPNKTEISYHVFLLLLLSSFRNNSESITKMYGSSSLKLRKIKLDFEVNPKSICKEISISII